MNLCCQFFAITKLVVACVFLWVNCEYWYPQNPILADWLTIEFMFPLFLGVTRILECVYLLITDTDNTCMFHVVRRVLAVLTLIFRVFCFFWFTFLYGWTFYGIVLITESQHNVGFWFHLMVMFITIVQLMCIIVSFIALLIVGFYWTLFKEEIRYKYLIQKKYFFSTKKNQGQRRRCEKNYKTQLAGYR